MGKLRKSKISGVAALALTIVLVLPTIASAHCDTLDGPTVGDARTAIETNNVNYVLKWVTVENEKEVTKLFELTMKEREESPESQLIADNYFFENVVKIHREGEGAPYEGLQPAGTPIDEIILAADKSIEIGHLSPLAGMVPQDRMPELIGKFEKVMSLKDFDVNDVEAGREYIEAYVGFFKFAEGEEEPAVVPGDTKTGGHVVQDFKDLFR